MGRRKERRLAAMSAAGRRVKLDLSTEPSGDLGGLSAQDEVGGDDDPGTAEFQSSHTSSGHQRANPLLLLEQYSNEEIDEGYKENTPAAVDASSDIYEAKSADQEETETAGKDDVEKLNSQIEEFLKDNLPSEDLPEKNERMSTMEINDAVAENNAEHDKQLEENIISGWKMVLHEESNRYYYWNIVTGETSWEVPYVLSQENVKSENFDGQVDSAKESDWPGEGPVTDCIAGNNQTSEGHSVDSFSMENGTNTDISSKLMKKCQSLMERLESVKSSKCNLDSHQCVKYMVEIEIRYGDINAMASYGSHLLPFWLHSEARLNQLEVCIDSHLQSNNSIKDINGFGPSEKLALVSSGDTKADPIATVSDIKILDHAADISGHDPNLLSSSPQLKHVGENNGTSEAEKVSELIRSQGLYFRDDLQMDVDMEVEEMPSVNPVHQAAPVAQPCASLEPSDVPDRIGEPETVVLAQVVSSFSAGEWIPPPPPDDAHIPPPPPDDEPCPPPPPHEASELSYSVLQMGPVPYFQQPGVYIASYPAHSQQYYGQTDIGVAGASLYPQPDSGHIGIQYLPHYYDPVTNSYAVAPMVANPVQPVAYYNIQTETLHPGQSMPGSTGQTSFGSIAEPNSGLSLNADAEAVKSTDIYRKASPDLDTRPASVAPENLTSSSNVAAAAASKAQSKVSRGKKRVVGVGPTLRTNKKVSGLVDKWKAVKEKLHEDEEPEDPYEILEKKRRREIEEWRASQLASGAAKDNANFQPLGGDWRERVKRKKGEKKKEAEPNTGDGKEKPDLVELAKGLPSGWQAYWDESSKQVYYGNVITSETTWTRPKA